MRSDGVFIDTNGWIAALNAADSFHQLAAQRWKEVIAKAPRVVLSDWIVAETGNGLARTRSRSVFVHSAEILLRNPRVEIVYVAEELLRRGLTLYTSRADKSWGLVDCVSFEVMREQEIIDAFTNDSHFIQAGFRCLLSPS